MRCHGPELRGGVIAVGTGYAYPPNLTTICGGPSTGHPLIKSLADIYTTIEQGRNVMPSWSIRYQGALDDQQINDIVNYLVFMSSKNVPFKDNICTNPDAVKAVNSPSPVGGLTGATSQRAPRARAAPRAAARRVRRERRLMLAQQVHTCLGFHIDCGTLFKGAAWS